MLSHSPTVSRQMLERQILDELINMMFTNDGRTVRFKRKVKQ